jgi:16S rRNA (cytidine1402-2'-O)-methyltransferase
MIGRELTKLFEETRSGMLAELAECYAQAGAPKGEVTVVIAPPAEREPASRTEFSSAAEVDRRLVAALQSGSLRDAVDRVTAETGLPRRHIYARAQQLKDAGR